MPKIENTRCNESIHKVILVKRWKSTCLLVEEGLEMQGICTTEYDAVGRRNEALTHLTPWMKVKNIRLSDIS